MKIDLFVPNPLRCFKCQRGHGQIHVKVVKLAFALVVVKRGMTAKAAKKTVCVKFVRVITCHMSSSKQFPIWKKNSKN